MKWKKGKPERKTLIWLLGFFHLFLAVSYSIFIPKNIHLKNTVTLVFEWQTSFNPLIHLYIFFVLYNQPYDVNTLLNNVTFKQNRFQNSDIKEFLEKLRYWTEDINLEGSFFFFRGNIKLLSSIQNFLWWESWFYFAQFFSLFCHLFFIFFKNKIMWMKRYFRTYKHISK